ncbi:MAG: efflux RND transporter periplasmic adaptor subunit [bacterium]
MSLFRKKRLWFTLLAVVIVVVVGGYLAKGAFRGGPADAADSLTALSDSTTDSTAAHAEGKDKDGKDKKKEPDPVPVEISTVQPREISSFHYTTATLDPEREVDVLAKAAGEIVKLNVEEGDVVEEGAILCQIEDSEQRVALDEAKINLENSKSEYDRIKTMFDEKLISDREFSEAKYQYELAQNSYEAAALRHEYTRVRAPFAGVVTKRYIERGQNVAVGTQLFGVSDNDPLLIRMYLPENEIRDIVVGQLVTIHPDNAPDQVLSGRVVRIAPEVDERTGTVKVTAETRGEAMPGSFARVKIVTDTRRGSLTIPRRGLISDAGELYVYVAEADTARKQPVHIGYQDEMFAEVLDGVEKGDSVVVVGVGGLRTGTKIKVLDPSMQQELSEQGEKTPTDTVSN